MSTAEFDIETGQLIERPLTEDEQAELTARTAAAEAELIQNELEQASEQTIKQNLLQGLDTVNQHIDAINAPAPTAAQQKAALLFCLRAVKALARLELRKLDSAD